ncbi:phytoene/squalene synthase family protein [Corynebacterium heidelbergense]|uniref:phytoene/squalene synthase family protein n=1 Tax=Corynebacterium heidelbergense TaxID=2055947 RepID=UPI001874023B|nr:squalene/phytoene synthase family protein [Corynebacterium heidelbergense]
MSRPSQSLLDRYNAMSIRAAGRVISSYSSSFSLATNLLPSAMRRDIANLYAMVRIADEIVDGTAEEAGLTAEQVARALDDYERAVLAAPDLHFHVDPVLHAYAETARRCRFNPDHVRAFFRSMRMDLSQATHDPESLGEYIYGSAEVIGLLCVSVFLSGEDATPGARAELDRGARALGAAFQKVNFLRDFAQDEGHLGRVYFPEIQQRGLTEETKAHLVRDIQQDLRVARAAVPGLPRGAQVGVAAAAGLFEELNNRIDRMPAEAVRAGRVSVPGPVKLRIAAKEAAQVARRSWRPE